MIVSGEFEKQYAVSNMSVRRINRVRVLKLLFHSGSLTQMEIKAIPHRKKCQIPPSVI